MSATPQTTDTTSQQKDKSKVVADANTQANTNTTANTTGTQATVNNGVTTQNTAQNGVTASVNQQDPYAPTAPLLQDIINQAGTLPSVAPTTNETAALGGLQDAAGTAAGFNPQITNLAQDQLAGGGVGAGTGDVNDAYATAKTNLTPVANGGDLDLQNNPYIKGLLDTVQQNVNNSVGGQFANAGRSFSGAHANALAMGITNAEAPILLDQYNKERGYQTDAISQLLSGANNKAGVLDASATGANAIKNQAAGTLATTYNPFTTMLSGEEAGRNIPVDALQKQANIATGLAGVGSSGSSLGVNQQTGLQQGTQSDTGLVNTNQNANTATDATTDSHSKTKSTGTSAATGTSTVTPATDPLQTAIGGGIGVLGLLSGGTAGGLGGALGTAAGKYMLGG